MWKNRVFEEAESYFYSIFRLFFSLVEKRFQCESLLPSLSESVKKKKTCIKCIPVLYELQLYTGVVMVVKMFSEN
jgi:hypothetical protein